MSAYDVTNAGVAAKIAELFDITSAGTATKINEGFDITSLGIASLVYQSRIFLFTNGAFTPYVISYSTSQQQKTAGGTSSGGIVNNYWELYAETDYGFTARTGTIRFDATGFSNLRLTYTLSSSSGGGDSTQPNRRRYRFNASASNTAGSDLSTSSSQKVQDLNITSFVGETYIHFYMRATWNNGKVRFRLFELEMI